MNKDKVGDFFIGLFVTIAVEVLGWSFVRGRPIAWAVPFVALVGVIIAAIVKRRPFIALGAAASVALMFLVFGACIYMIAGHL